MAGIAEAAVDRAKADHGDQLERAAAERDQDAGRRLNGSTAPA
jgi:hypothetical protein